MSATGLHQLRPKQQQISEPPSGSPDLEKLLIGGILNAPDANEVFARVSEIVGDETAFIGLEKCRLIFSAMRNLVSRGVAIGLNALHVELTDRDQLRYVGGLSGLMEFAESPALLGIESYALKIREDADRRRAWVFFHDQMIRVCSRDPLDEIADRTADFLPSMRQQQNGGDIDRVPSLHRLNWPDPLETAAFHGLAGEITRTIEPHSEADPAAVLVQFLVAFGNLIGRRAHFKAEADRHFLNLFTVIVGQTSKGRKGSSLGQVQNFLRTVDCDWSLERTTSGLSTGEGLIWAVRDPIYKTESVKDNKGRVVSHQQVIEEAGIEDKRLLVQEPEFARVLQAADRKENTLSSVLRLAWDTGDLSTITRKQSARATHAHISLIAHVTKDELRRLLTDTSAANGFANRFCWVCAKRSKLLPEGGELHTVDLSPLTRRLTAAAEFARTVGEMKRDHEARALWRDIYADLSEGRPGLLGAVTSRAESITMRLACLYALLDQSDTVRIEHLQAALAVWRYCEASARFVFGDQLGDETADEILRALRSSPAGMTRTDFRDYFKRNKQSAEIARALGVLQEMGLARMEKKQQDGAGRPTEVWFAV